MVNACYLIVYSKLFVSGQAQPKARTGVVGTCRGRAQTAGKLHRAQL